jgi:peroxiredoxin
MDAMLTPRQMLPPLVARTAEGRVVRAWDFKQKRNLVVVFLDAAAEPARAWLARLSAAAADLAERNATAIVVLAEPVPASLADRFPGIVLAADPSGRAHRACLGSEAFGPAGLERAGAFVADRYGEIYAAWAGRDVAALPGIEAVLSWLAQIELACEECGAPHWPA